jgi:hypothetical protein
MNNFLNKWHREDMLNHLDAFNTLYESRPIKDNNGGMKSGHMFPAWYVVKKLKPKYLIESGVWKGLGTWFFEQASPETQIISIDPAPNFRIYTSPKSTYQTLDFLKTDWSHIPKEDAMIFFDDHQDFLERLKHAQLLGFKHIMTEDNYPHQQGDCYTPKKILANTKYVIDLAGNRTWREKNDSDLEYFKNNVKIYQEMPPIFKDETTRWGDAWDHNYPTPEPLLTTVDKEKYPLFFNEKKDYTWICYLELN